MLFIFSSLKMRFRLGVGGFVFLAAQCVLSDANGQMPPGAVNQPPVINQPITIQSFENVEMEKLRLGEEVAKIEREEADFQKQILQLQKKLGSASAAAMMPESLPSDWRSFMSAKAGDIQKSEQYYRLMKSVLNDLTPDSPYRARTVEDTSSPQRAAQNLLKLSEFAEDDDISRSIQGHIASLTGGRIDDNRRLLEINREMGALETERKRLEWNLKMTYSKSLVSGKESGSDADRDYINNQIQEVKMQVEALKLEKNSLGNLVTSVQKKLQFQQLILELAFQQRYIHSLIAAGFYRNSFKGGDLAISQEAYPTGRSSSSGKNNQDSAGKSSGKETPTSEVPMISTISGLEVFLQNRIKDAIKERDSIDNMVKENQLSAAESILRKMLLTAKYQPELNTIPYEERQKILQFAQTVQRLSDSLNSKDYVEIKKLNDQMDKMCSDASVADIKMFAAEHPKKALFWVNQAEIAMKLGDRKTANTLMNAAIGRAPTDTAVSEKIKDLQESVVKNSKLLDELKTIIKNNDYTVAFDRMNEFSPLAASGSDETLKSQFQLLIEKEKAVQKALEKSDAFERMANYPNAWVTLCEMPKDLRNDSRIIDRKTKISGECPSFIAAYSKAVANAANPSISLAWYLTALLEAQGCEELTTKVNQLSASILNH